MRCWARPPARHPERIALRFLPQADADADVFSISYQTLFDKVTQAANALPTTPASRRTRRSPCCCPTCRKPTTPCGAPRRPASPVPSTAAAGCRAYRQHYQRHRGPQRWSPWRRSPAAELWDKALALTERCPSLRTVFMVDLEAYAGPAEQRALHSLRRQAALPTPAVQVLSFGAALAEQASDQLVSGRCIQADQLCAYFHTGGTTGLPKIARHTHGNEVFVASMPADAGTGAPCGAVRPAPCSTSTAPWSPAWAPSTAAGKWCC